MSIYLESVARETLDKLNRLTRKLTEENEQASLALDRVEKGLAEVKNALSKSAEERRAEREVREYYETLHGADNDTA